MDPGAIIDAWRKRGDHRFDPVRLRFIEALARRAAAHHGDARRILDDKLARLLAAYGEDLERARSTDGDTTRAQGPSRRGPLAELVDHVARHPSSHGDGTAARDTVASLSAPAELKTLRYFRSTWSKLSADRRLTQSLAKMPQNAGPLNSHHLVHRSLTLMRDLSPEYLNRFMSYVDALLWLDQVNGGSALAGTDAPRAESHRKAARGRSG
ncbi:DUF2894 domain-containing protein [Variovorax sp. M-6]|uniref:DUF2894 domain-containing protein n=1 Tax=Variovorax sp. M-6 TaxID=3233041 RepID=UPI003F9A2558